MTMPLSLMGASVFSEALWQRVWASQDHRTLKLGSYIGCAAIIFVVFVCGMFGFLASWAGLIDENTNPNLYLFQVNPRFHTRCCLCVPIYLTFCIVLPLAYI